MGRRRAYSPLNVFISGRLVGQLLRQSTGAVSFTYDRTWLEWEHTLPISLSLPLRETRYTGAIVMAVFDNLLPDNEAILRRVAERVGAEGTDAYSMLTKIGRDCVGAMQFMPDGEEPSATNVLEGEELDKEAIAAILKDLKNTPLGLDQDDAFRISVAGAQEKTALLWYDGKWMKPSGTTPTTHIIKPQIGELKEQGVDLSNSVENEHFCLELLKRFGLRTANTEIHLFDDQKALAVERFDRLWSRDGRLIRLPQEDCCQALGVPPTKKYQASDGGPGIIDIVKLMRSSDEPELDQADFFKANILFWLIGATDGHAKNFSIELKPGGRFRMTPLYDVLTVQPSLDAKQLNRKNMKMAMRVGDGNHYRVDEIVGRHFIETGLRAGLSRSVIERIIAEIASQSDQAVAETVESMADGFPDEIINSTATAIQNRVPLLMAA